MPKRGTVNPTVGTDKRVGRRSCSHAHPSQMTAATVEMRGSGTARAWGLGLSLLLWNGPVAAVNLASRVRVNNETLVWDDTICLTPDDAVAYRVRYPRGWRSRSVEPDRVQYSPDQTLAHLLAIHTASLCYG